MELCFFPIRLPSIPVQSIAHRVANRPIHKLVTKASLKEADKRLVDVDIAVCGIRYGNVGRWRPHDISSVRQISPNSLNQVAILLKYYEGRMPDTVFMV